MPHRGFAEHADDVAALLDHLNLSQVFVYGESGAAPHILSFLARHPHRVQAATISVGIAPLNDNENSQLIGLNAQLNQLVDRGDTAGLEKLLSDTRDSLLAAPLAGVRAIMDTAPASDHEVISNPIWQSGFSVGVQEALAQGVGGWADEWTAFRRPWQDIDLSAISTRLTWWHATGDRNCPASAAERLVRQLPTARFRLWSEGGHYLPYLKLEEILDDLLSPQDSAAPASRFESIDRNPLK